MATSQVHPDHPTLHDRLEWNMELERLVKRLKTAPMPHVMGIYGDWGSGKTSFMRQLQWRLGGDMPDDGTLDLANAPTRTGLTTLQKQYVTLWFDAWRYQNEAVPVVALLQEMRRQFGLIKAVQEKFKKLGEVTLKYTLNGLADLGKVIGVEGLPSAEKIEKVGSDWERDHFAQPGQADAIRHHLQETVASLLPTKDSRVIVFIDDLDRCNPKAAVRLLEGLKIYLSLPNCLFVLGMNERVLIDGIRDELSAPKETPPAELKLQAAHYLEKICTDVYRLPLPGDPLSLFTGWLTETEHKQALTAALGSLRCLPPNPRRLKALANQWERFATAVPLPAVGKAQEIWAVRALVAAYVHQFHRDLWERWHFDPSFWVEINQWCKGTSVVDPSTAPDWTKGLRFTGQWESAGWKTNYPNPGDVDLFWLSGLIRQYDSQLVPLDFEPLLRRA